METITQNAWQYYYYLALFATIFFGIKLIIFTIFGGDGCEVQTDFNIEMDSDPSFSFLSLQSILAFLMGFGWMGYACLHEFKFSQITTLLCAIVIGLIFMFIMAFLMFSVKKLEKNVKKDLATSIGKTGKAYTNFDNNGYGKIEIEVSGQLSIIDAYNMTDTPIKSFETVEVIGQKDGILQVKKSQINN